jgi:hypothetical protein
VLWIGRVATAAAGDREEPVGTAATAPPTTVAAVVRMYTAAAGRRLPVAGATVLTRVALDDAEAGSNSLDEITVPRTLLQSLLS